ncbi:RNase H domain-containing protein [Trichonephila clavipes]|nr:RNase H domain-containing protein [Trichonephila clavipes]
MAITSLLTTTKGTDICTAVRNSLAEKEIDLKKIVSVTTDGAPNMMDAFRATRNVTKEKDFRRLLEHMKMGNKFVHQFRPKELLTSTPKHSSHPELLRQLALEVINDIPNQALINYTDGSRSDTGRVGSGIFSNTPGNDVKISIRNPDHCSVFRL